MENQEANNNTQLFKQYIKENSKFTLQNVIENGLDDNEEFNSSLEKLEKIYSEVESDAIALDDAKVKVKPVLDELNILFDKLKKTE